MTGVEGAGVPGADAPGLGLQVSGLSVFSNEASIVEPLDFSVRPGETLAIIGESGSGKSMTARAIMGLLPRGVQARGQATIDQFEYKLDDASERDWARVRGRRAVLMLQDPFTSLSHVMRCGAQLALTVRARAAAEGARLTRGEVQAEVAQRLDEVRLPPYVARRYPFELSGGMRQRVAIAAALAARPRLLIADEPTTALDASTQGEVLDLLGELQTRHAMSMILISHDLGIIEGRADKLLVMRRGEVVERGDTRTVLHSPQAEYTRTLIAANPSIADLPAAQPAPVRPGALVADGLTKTFDSLRALSNASLSVAPGEVLAVVGESGSGKSTLARLLAGLDAPDAGSVTLDGRVLPPRRRGRRPDEIQVVFQDPYSTLNPSFTVGQTLRVALGAAPRPGTGAAKTAEELLRLVDLDPALIDRRPSQLSGGQRQRVAIARAIAPNPRVLICDESVSALDVSVQAQVLGLLARLRDELDLAMIFITHDLGVVARIADTVVVLRGGEIVERGQAATVLREPAHAYTRLLLAAAERDSVRRAPTPESEPTSTPDASV